ncbi:hypothetical protein A9Q96_13635 [Rhodobacterales bacterium 52_120_T64]|nr:hypothetical protein A9Q96_13635 [Rhodobacterales bacterium 52_120_T64]
MAFGKAWGALGMGISSRLIRECLTNRPTFQNSLAASSDRRLIPVLGGVLVRDSEDFAIGAVGIGGDTSNQQEYCAIEGIKSAGLLSEPANPDPEWGRSSLSDSYPGAN